MQPDQKALYYITGGDENMLRKSPLLRFTRRRTSKSSFSMTKSMRSSFPPCQVRRHRASGRQQIRHRRRPEGRVHPREKRELKPLLEKIKSTLGDAVKEVRASSRLADSPSVIVSDEDEPSARMRQMMQAMGQKKLPELQPTLEINPDHEIIRKLLADPSNNKVEDAAWLLFEQALLLEGVPLKDPAAFVQRLNRVLNQSI